MSATQTLGDLKREARKIARESDHDLGKWSTGQVLTMADCKRCGSTCYIDPHPFGDSEPISRCGKCPGDKLAAKLREILSTRRVFTRTEYVGNAGTAYVRAYVADRDSIDEITWEIGRLLDEPTVHGRGGSEHHGLKRGGYGYNRALDVLSAVARKVGLERFEQGHWTEMS